MPTEEELEQRVTDHIDSEEAKKAVLSFEIEQMNESIKKARKVMNFER